MPLSSRPSPVLALTLLWLVIFPEVAGLATEAPADSRQETVARFNDLMSRGERRAALPICRRYTDDYPADAVMLYNLACLENTVGDPSLAATAFAAAVGAGFNDFERALADPDLQGSLANEVSHWRDRRQQEIMAQAARQGMRLEFNKWSDPRSLVRHGPVREIALEESPAAGIRVRWQEAGLELEVTVDQAWAGVFGASTAAPWQGGPALLVSISVPDSTDTLSAKNHFLFAFGMDVKGATGGLFVSPFNHWQPVAELTPKIKTTQADRMQLKATIPWQALMPYDPLIDTPLGINATLHDPRGVVRSASLVETSDTLDPLAPRRRFARLDFQTDSVASDQFSGKLSASISRDRPLDLDLVAISEQAGEAVLSLNFMDQAGRSVLPDGPIAGKLTLRAGTNHLHRQADFRSLNLGGYLLQTELTFPSGARQTWGATVLQLPDGWRDRYEEQASLVAAGEQATVHYHLDAVTTAIASLQTRRSPGAIVASLMDLDQMLADAADLGTILPEKGSFVMVYPGPDGGQRICRLYLPAGREHSDGLNPILVLSADSGPVARLAARIGRNYEHGDRKPTLKTGDDNRFPVYLVPELAPGHRSSRADLFAEAEACRNWAMATFATPVVSLVGMDEMGATTLALFRTAPTTLAGLMVFAGAGLDPWPQAQPEFIRRQLGPPPADLPITWVDFGMETRGGGQAPLILQALKDLGYTIAAEQEVRGSLSSSQVADRVVIWAESLR